MLRFVLTLALVSSAALAQVGRPFAGQPSRPSNDDDDDGPPISKAFKALSEVCGDSDTLPEHCSCAGGISFPEDIDDFGKCKPISCTCPGDNELKIITFFGCANGGVPE